MEADLPEAGEYLIEKNAPTPGWYVVGPCAVEARYASFDRVLSVTPGGIVTIHASYSAAGHR